MFLYFKHTHNSIFLLGWHVALHVNRRFNRDTLAMYRKDPFKDDSAAHQRGIALIKPFKTPSLANANQREQPQRKRKRVSYKENAPDEDGEGGRRSKKRRDDTYGEPLSDTVNLNKTFPVYDAKPSSEVFTKKFLIPEMKSKDGQSIRMHLTGTTLGVRPPKKLLPKPLHDPMAEHAVVLYDPTIDDRETDEERQERLKEEAKEQAKKEAAAKVAGMYNPHKSLREILGEGTSKKISMKVPVVIDPVLSRILRPHQLEGVKVCIFNLSHDVDSHVLVSLSVHIWDGRRKPIRMHHG